MQSQVLLLSLPYVIVCLSKECHIHVAVQAYLGGTVKHVQLRQLHDNGEVCNADSVASHEV